MFLVGLLSWWYGNGWRNRLAKTGRQLTEIAELFSIGQLASTLFAPYRQISAGGVRGPIGAQARAFLDRQVSRVIGAIVRTVTIIAGILTLLFMLIVQTFILLFWLVMPFAIIAGIIATVIGWVPIWR